MAGHSFDPIVIVAGMVPFFAVVLVLLLVRNNQATNEGLVRRILRAGFRFLYFRPPQTVVHSRRQTAVCRLTPGHRRLFRHSLRFLGRQGWPPQPRRLLRLHRRCKAAFPKPGRKRSATPRSMPTAASSCSSSLPKVLVFPHCAAIQRGAALRAGLITYLGR